MLGHVSLFAVVEKHIYIYDREYALNKYTLATVIGIEQAMFQSAITLPN